MVVDFGIGLECRLGVEGPMASSKPRRIPGRWREGYALDVHTVSSTYTGDNEFGHPTFSTERSEVGELLYKLKYQGNQSVVPELVDVAASFAESWKPGVDVLVPVPASRARAVQPVLIVGGALATRLSLPFGSGWIRKAKDVPELKNVHDLDERMRLLDGAHAVESEQTKGRRILLFDDLFRSGATLNAITELLIDQGGAEAVFALTLTRTRGSP